MQAVDEEGIYPETGRPGCEECGEPRGCIVFYMPEGRPDSPYWGRSDSPDDPTVDHAAAQSKLL
jgi:hypothetical protein